MMFADKFSSLLHKEIFITHCGHHCHDLMVADEKVDVGLGTFVNLFCCQLLMELTREFLKDSLPIFCCLQITPFFQYFFNVYKRKQTMPFLIHVLLLRCGWLLMRFFGPINNIVFFYCFCLVWW